MQMDLLGNETDQIGSDENGGFDANGSSQASFDDSLLISLVRNFEILYDKGSRNYKNNFMRDSAWTTVGEIMKVPPSECLKCWSQLRDGYAREKRKRTAEERSGSGYVKRRGFIYYREMQFLDRHVTSRRAISNVPYPGKTLLQWPLCNTSYLQGAKAVPLLPIPQSAGASTSAQCFHQFLMQDLIVSSPSSSLADPSISFPTLQTSSSNPGMSIEPLPSPNANVETLTPPPSVKMPTSPESTPGSMVLSPESGTSPTSILDSPEKKTSVEYTHIKTIK